MIVSCTLPSSSVHLSDVPKTFVSAGLASRAPRAPNASSSTVSLAHVLTGIIRIPQHLESAPKPPPDSPPFILDELHEAAKKTVMDWQWQLAGSSSHSDLDCGAYTPETVEILLSRQDLSVSEVELIQLRWCRKNQSALQDYLHFFDFTLLNAEQKQWVMSQLPPTELYPMLIQNALCQ